MINKYIPISSFTLDQIAPLNEMLRTLFEWLSRVDYEKVSDATTAPSGGTHGKMIIQDDGTNRILWVYVSSAWINVGDLISALTEHTHSTTTGEGGQLDWDTAFSDAVHSHASNAEGGTLDWDNVWSDAVHSHRTTAEGGDEIIRYAFMMGA